MASKNHGTGQREVLPGMPDPPGYDEELHALWLEKCDLQDAAASAREALKKKDEEARGALRRKGLDHYKVGEADLWAEPQPHRIKAKKAGARPKGKIKKVTAGDGEGVHVDAGVRDRLAAAAQEDEREN